MSGLVQALSVLGLDHGDHGSGHEVMKSNGEHLMPSSMNLKKIVGAVAQRPRSPQRRPMSDLILALTALGYTLVGAHWLTCRRR